MSKVRLGPVQNTIRGFELIEFKDRDGDECSLQMSSIAEFKKPGTSAVRLGLESEPHDKTGLALGARMHLTRQQVAALIAHLQSWLERDTFRL